MRLYKTRKCKNDSFEAEEIGNCSDWKRSGTIVDTELRCSSKIKCLLRTCQLCVHKRVHISEFDGDEEIHYDQWEKKLEVVDSSKYYYRTVKNCNKRTQHELVDTFLNNMKHVGYTFINRNI